MADTPSNPFDQFDAPSADNPFDQFDAPEAKPASLGRKIGDVGLSLAKGVVAVPEAAVGLADLVTGGKAGKAAEAAGVRFKEAKEILSEAQSDDLKAKQQKFQDADGVVDKVVTAVTNPSLIVNTAAESLPLMGAGGIAGRAVLPALGARMAAPTAAAMAGGIGEGVVGAGSAAEQIRQESATGELTAGQAGLAAGSGIATGVIGVGGGMLAKRLGIADPDTMAVAGRGVLPPAPPNLGARAKNMLRRAAEGAVSEGILEELPQSIVEQGFQNAALDRPLTEGMTDAAVMGALTGGVMGAGAGALSKPAAAPPPPPRVPGPLEQAAALAPLALPAPGSLPPAGEAIQVDAEGTAARGTEFDYLRGQSRGAREGVKKGPPNRPIAEAGAMGEGRDKTGPALRLPPPTINVDSEGTARAPGQNIPPAPPPGPRETGAIGAGRNSQDVGITRRLPFGNAPVQVDRDDRATTGNERGQELVQGRQAAQDDASRRQDLGLPQRRGDDLVHESGQPFRSRFAAQRAAKQAGVGFQAIPISGGGFVVRRANDQAQDVEVKNAPAPSPAPAAARAAAPAPAAAPVQPAAGERPPGAVPVTIAAAPAVPAAAGAPGPAPAPQVAAAPKPAGLRVGITPTDTVPVTVRDGVVYVGKYPAVHYESGEDVRVPQGANDLQIRKALADAGALSNRQRIFGSSETTAAAPAVAPAPAPQQNDSGAAATPAATSNSQPASEAQTAFNTPKGDGQAPVPDVPAKVEPQQAETPPAGGPEPAGVVRVLSDDEYAKKLADEARHSNPANAPVVKTIGKAPNIAVLIDGIPHKSGFKTEIEARQAAAQEIARRAAIARGAEVEAEDDATTVATEAAKRLRREHPDTTNPRVDRILSTENKLQELARNEPERAEKIAKAWRADPQKFSDATGLSPDRIGSLAGILEQRLKLTNPPAVAAPAPATAKPPIETDLDGTKVWAAVEYAAGREIAHGIRRGDEAAIEAAAKALAPLVGPKHMLVPIPGAKGVATVTARLAHAIANISGSGVDQGALTGAKRESLYELKKRGGDLASVDLGLEFNPDSVEGLQVVLVDNVLATGTTARAAITAVKAEGLTPTVMVYAIDRAAQGGNTNEGGPPWNPAGDLSYQRQADGSLHIRGEFRRIADILLHGTKPIGGRVADKGAYSLVEPRHALAAVQKLLDYAKTGTTPAQLANPVNSRERAADVKPEESLLLMPCSDTKAEGGEMLAGRLYLGPMWQTLRAKIKEGARQPTIAILSAKHGIIDLGTRIAPYDQLLDADRARHFLHPTELPKLIAELRRILKGYTIRDVQIAGGEHYREVMRAVVRGVMDGAGGLIAQDASVRETTGRGIGDHRAQLGAYLDGFKPAKGSTGNSVSTGPAPAIETTKAADRVGKDGPISSFEGWETIAGEPTDAEILDAGQALKPGMYLHTSYGSGVNHEIVAVVTQDTHKGDPGWQQPEPGEVFTQLHMRVPGRARAKLSYLQVFLRDGKVYEVATGMSDTNETEHPRVYVLDGPMQANGAAPAPAPAPTPAPAAPVRASRETIDLRKRVVAMGKLIDCLKRGK